jgi:hypothetical protein
LSECEIQSALDEAVVGECDFTESLSDLKEGIDPAEFAKHLFGDPTEDEGHTNPKVTNLQQSL